MGHARNKTIDLREVELKFQFSPGGHTKLEKNRVLAGTEAKKLHQVTTYFDTPNAVLHKAGLTLRVRKSGKLRIQTVKSRADGRGVATGRKEWEWPIAQNMPDVEKLINTRGLCKFAKQIKGKLEPVFVTDIQRTVRLLRQDGNSIVEAAIDVGWIRSGITSEPVHELELELKGGGYEALYQLAAQFQKLAPLRISAESKAARGWHLRTGQTEPARAARLPKLRRNISVAEGFHKIIGGTLGHLIANIGPTLRGDPEGVHQMRIALRRCRAALKLFAPHLGDEPAGKFDEELQRLGRVFGKARDWDVFCLETLPAAMVELPAECLRDLKAPADVERRVAHASVINAICGPRFGALILELAIWTEAGLARPDMLGDRRMYEQLAALAPPLLDRIARQAMKKARHPGRLSAKKLHQLRKTLDQLCNDIEGVTGLFPPRTVESYRVQCEGVQEILGSANDAFVAKQLTLNLLKSGRTDLTRPGDILVFWSKRRRRKTMRGLKGALKHLRETPAFWSKSHNR